MHVLLIQKMVESSIAKFLLSPFFSPNNNPTLCSKTNLPVFQVYVISCCIRNKIQNKLTLCILGYLMRNTIVYRQWISETLRLRERI